MRARGAFSRRHLFLWAVLALCLALAPPAARAEGRERIIDFASRIVVHKDASLTVTETITAVAAGRRIKRGIYREFPTTYKDKRGRTVRVGFDVVSVLRDGKPEPYHTTSSSNGKRIYVGSKNVFLKPGEYTYTITYRTDRQIGFFPEFDELYWNVTGNGWVFPIERAWAVVVLPEGATVEQRVAYTGRQGSRGADYSTGRDSDGNVFFATTRRLSSREGLTIAVSWPKGFVTPPSESQVFFDENPGFLAALIGFMIVLLYYLFAWARVGRDPATGTIVPLFEPPKGFSPAAVRYVMGMGYSQKVFAAAVVSMAVKGYITIVENKKKKFSLKTTGADRSSLAAGEREIAKKLIGGLEEVKLETKNHQRIADAIKSLKKVLKRDFEKIHFSRNSLWIIPGVIITFLALVAVAESSSDPEMAKFFVIWLSIWTIGCAFLVARVVMSMRSGQFGGGIFMALFALPFLAGEIGALFMFGQLLSVLALTVLLVLLLMTPLFYQLLKAPSVLGRRTMDQIEGFKLYLSVAEKDRMNLLNPPDRTPELFEKYLPYALALDVENEWSEQFADVLAAAAKGGEAGYSPIWYTGGSWHHLGAAGLASNLGGSLSNAISSSSMAPGSSSGSGGGGFSGGGGGGGGGGGW